MAQMNVGTAKAVGPDRSGRTKVSASMVLDEREFSLSFDMPGFSSQAVRLWENGTPVGSGTARLLPAGRGSKPRIAINVSGTATVMLELAPKLPYQEDQEYTVYAISTPSLQPQPGAKAVNKALIAPQAPADPLAKKALTLPFDQPQPAPSTPTNALQNRTHTQKEILTMPSQAAMKMPKPKTAVGYKATPPADPMEDVKKALLATAATLDRLAASGTKDADGRKEKLQQMRAARRCIKALLDTADQHIDVESARAFWGGK